MHQWLRPHFWFAKSACTRDDGSWMPATVKYVPHYGVVRCGQGGRKSRCCVGAAAPASSSAAFTAARWPRRHRSGWWRFRSRLAGIRERYWVVATFATTLDSWDAMKIAHTCVVPQKSIWLPKWAPCSDRIQLQTREAPWRHLAVKISGREALCAR